MAEAEELIPRCLGIVEANLDPEGAKVSNTFDKRTRQLEWLKKAKGCLERCLAIKDTALECEGAGVEKF